MHVREQSDGISQQADESVAMEFMPAAKKQRVALGEMRAQASDGPVVRALLEKIRFDAKAWLAALAPEVAKI